MLNSSVNTGWCELGQSSSVLIWFLNIQYKYDDGHLTLKALYHVCKNTRQIFSTWIFFSPGSDLLLSGVFCRHIINIL